MADEEAIPVPDKEPLAPIQYGDRFRGHSNTIDNYVIPIEDERVTFGVKAPNIVTSLIDLGSNTHMPCIDIDGMKVQLRPSTTEGNYHLFIDKEVPWDSYLMLLDALVACGIVNQGFVDHARRRGFSSIRLQHKKGGPSSDSTKPVAKKAKKPSLPVS
jgi:hypothetical protein